MGRAATTPELDACAFDVVASGEPTYADAYAEVVEFRDEQRSAEVAPPPDRPTTTRSGGATAPTGTAALTLEGKLAPISDPEPPADAVPQLEGEVDVPDGSLILVSLECPAATDYVVTVSGPAGATTTLPLCGTQLGVPDDNDEPRSGEAYQWVADGGTHEITLEDLSPDGTTRRVELSVFVDNSPTADTSSGASWSGSLSGIGDVATLRIPGGTTNAKFAVTAAPGLCITSILLSSEDLTSTGIPMCDRPDPEIEVLRAPGTESIVIVHSRDAAGGTFELRRR